MAVKAVGSTRFKFLGLSTDTKPTDAPNGATFKSMDTGEVWLYFDGMWIMEMETAAIPQRVLLAI